MKLNKFFGLKYRIVAALDQPRNLTQLCNETGHSIVAVWKAIPLLKNCGLIVEERKNNKQRILSLTDNGHKAAKGLLKANEVFIEYH